MAKQFLDRTDVIAVLQKMSGEAVPKGMAGDVFSDFRKSCSLSYCLLNAAFMDMVPSDFAGTGVLT